MFGLRAEFRDNQKRLASVHFILHLQAAIASSSRHQHGIKFDFNKTTSHRHTLLQQDMLELLVLIIRLLIL